MTKKSPLYTIQTASAATILIAPLGDLEDLMCSAAPQDLTHIAPLSPKRQREQLTWRNMAREFLAIPKISFSYNDVGAPQIDGSDLHISVSHSSSLVAIMISPAPCAIDIEQLSRNFEKVAPRYIGPTEQSLSASPTAAAAIWCTKEALYKFAGRKQLDLLSDIKVMQLRDDSFSATITPHTTIITGTIITLDDHILACI